MDSVGERGGGRPVALERWKKLRRVFEIPNPWWTYRKEEFLFARGVRGEYHSVHTRGSSMVVPLTAGGGVLLVNQYRFLRDRESLELPCGSVKEGSDYDATAALELAEETGQSARLLLPVGEFNPYNGVTDEMCRVYIARDLTPRRLEKDPTEEFELRESAPHEVDSMIADGRIWDGMTIAAWTIARPHINGMTLKETT